MYEFRLGTHSLKFVSKGPINNIPALIQIMAWIIIEPKVT